MSFTHDSSDVKSIGSADSVSQRDASKKNGSIFAVVLAEMGKMEAAVAAWRDEVEELKIETEQEKADRRQIARIRRVFGEQSSDEEDDDEYDEDELWDYYREPRPIEDAINGEWKVIGVENFEQVARCRKFTEEKEHLWQYGRVSFGAGRGTFVRATLVNQRKRDLSVTMLNEVEKGNEVWKVTVVENNSIVTICRSRSDGSLRWSIARYIRDGRLHLVYSYPCGMTCTRILERLGFH